jgi:UDP-N-acetylmuramate--alanine ligase
MATQFLRHGHSVVTNMDPEHLDHWGTSGDGGGLRSPVANVPFYGFAVQHRSSRGAADDPRHRTGASSPTGFPQADVRADRVVPTSWAPPST